MNLELSEDQEFFRDTTRRFIDAEASVAANRARLDTELGFERVWWQTAAQLGWTAMFASESAGGGSLSGRPLTDAVIVAEEMGRQLVPGPMVPVNVVLAALARADNDAHATVAAALVSGESIASWAFGEPGSRWDPAAFTCTAEPDGSDIVVNGTKAYVEAGATAEHHLVVARTGIGLSQVLVPAGAHGLSVKPAKSTDLGRRFAELRFADVRVPNSAVVGEAGGAATDIERQLQIALALHNAETIGSLDRVFAFTLEYMGDRHAFGRPIASYQALKHRVADLLLVLESAKGCNDAAVRAHDNAAPEAALEASVAKAFIGDKALHFLQECTQFHGGIGVTWEHDLHLYLRRATTNRSLFGTPAQHRDRICSLLASAS